MPSKFIDRLQYIWILQAIKNWRHRRPGNEATKHLGNNLRTQKTNVTTCGAELSHFPNATHTCFWDMQSSSSTFLEAPPNELSLLGVSSFLAMAVLCRGLWALSRTTEPSSFCTWVALEEISDTLIINSHWKITCTNRTTAGAYNDKQQNYHGKVCVVFARSFPSFHFYIIMYSWSQL